MKINKVISNHPALRYANAESGFGWFKSTKGEVLFGVMPKMDINDPDVYGYKVKVGKNVGAGDCRVVGVATDFNVACDMMLEELGIMETIVK